jgi:glycine hydroxymethyltransferase
LQEEDFDVVADFLHRGAQLAVKAQQVAELEGGNTKVLLKDFIRVLSTNLDIEQSIRALRQEVEDFALKFEMPGTY